MLYDKELRRTLKSILLSFKQILQLILFFLLMTIFWAVIAVKMIGSLDDEVKYDEVRL